MSDHDWAHGVDVTTPNVARMYDYFLGGGNNFTADRDAARKVLTVIPEVPLVARENRGFLARAVRFLADAGVRQFLDIGAGLPTQGNDHEVAHQVNPDARVVYVDNDPVVLAHGRAILAGVPNATIIGGDLRHPDQILDHRELRVFLDLDEPIAVLLVAVLHFLADSDNPHEIVAQLRRAVAPGSYLAISHGTADPRPGDAAIAAKVYDHATSAVHGRSHAEVRRFFAGLDLLDPGVVFTSEWRADRSVPNPEQAMCYAGIGRKKKHGRVTGGAESCVACRPARQTFVEGAVGEAHLQRPRHRGGARRRPCRAAVGGRL